MTHQGFIATYFQGVVGGYTQGHGAGAVDGRAQGHASAVQNGHYVSSNTDSSVVTSAFGSGGVFATSSGEMQTGATAGLLSGDMDKKDSQ
jgi:hypothetical protein